MNKKRDLVLSIAGLAILGVAVNRIGFDHLLEQSNVLRIGLPIILLLTLARLLLQTAAWRIALRCERIEAPARELMLVRLASQGMGYLTVLGPAASEPMKIRLLRHHSGSATTATLVDTGTYWIASSLVGIAGCIAAGTSLAGHQNAASPILVIAFLVCIVAVIASPKSPLSQIATAIGRRCPKWLRKAASVDAQIREFAAAHPGAVKKMFAIDVICQALVACEVAAVFWSLHLPLHLNTVLGLEAGTRIVKIFAGAMPARIGADESGAAAAFVAFGLPAASGLALALARRCKDVLSCLVGLVWLASQRRLSEEQPEKIALAPLPLLTGTEN